MKIMVKDATGLTNLKPGAIIGVGDKVYQVVPPGTRFAQVVAFADEKQSVELTVKEFGKIRRFNDYQQSARN